MGVGEAYRFLRQGGADTLAARCIVDHDVFAPERGKDQDSSDSTRAEG
jgi:hypothetical protein